MKYQINFKKLNYKLSTPLTSFNFTEFKDFKFGFASAAAQIENNLNDIWYHHAKEGKIPGYFEDDPNNIRNNFWNHSHEELEYVYDTNVDIFRMGIDWERICPTESEFNSKAINKYKSILQEIKSKNIKTMVTLYHHSEPKWTHKKGSWSNPHLIKHFSEYVEFVAKHLSPYVDYWNTFNEIQMYITLTQLNDFWPCVYKRPKPYGLLNFGPFKGCYSKSIKHVALAHNSSYKILKKYSNAQISIAHNLAYYTGENFLGRIAASISWKKFNFELVDLIKDHIDFLGINYYGSEILKNFNLTLSPLSEYSDSGRGIYPKGLYEMLNIFYSKYKKPIFITENGVSDKSEKIRPQYMIEHLLGVQQALTEGIPIMGYIWWSMTDNLEWADGYAPKFGLVEVKRNGNEVIRTKRASYDLYKEIVKNRKLDHTKILDIRKQFKQNQGTLRTLTRDIDAQKPLHKEREEIIKNIDWTIS